MIKLIRPPTTLLVMISTNLLMFQSMIFLFLMTSFSSTEAQSTARVLVIAEKTQADLVEKLMGNMKRGETDALKFDFVIYRINHEEEETSYKDACGELQQKPFSALLDMSWGGWDAIKESAQKNGLPYLRIETAKHQFVKVGLLLMFLLLIMQLLLYRLVMII